MRHIRVYGKRIGQKEGYADDEAVPATCRGTYEWGLICSRHLPPIERIKEESRSRNLTRFPEIGYKNRS